MKSFSELNMSDARELPICGFPAIIHISEKISRSCSHMKETSFLMMIKYTKCTVCLHYEEIMVMFIFATRVSTLGFVSLICC